MHTREQIKGSIKKNKENTKREQRAKKQKKQNEKQGEHALSAGRMPSPEDKVAVCWYDQS